MIVRVVRMHITVPEISRFLEIFNEHQQKIRNFQGCLRLELLKDPDDQCCFTTLSHWDTDDDLESYRSSPVFREVWLSVKPLFYQRAVAFSLTPFIEVAG